MTMSKWQVLIDKTNLQNLTSEAVEAGAISIWKRGFGWFSFSRALGGAVVYQ